MVGVGKSYIPVEKGEVGRSVRKMIVAQLERSAMIAWESRPRDLFGEILMAEQSGVLPVETASLGRNDYTVGQEIPVDPSSPPWGDVKHAGWSSPAQGQDEDVPDLQFATVIAELPNLIEAQAVSLAPPDTGIVAGSAPIADPVVAEVLRRPATMGMREYLSQLSYLQLVNPPEIGLRFLLQYEKARFHGNATTEADFKHLMASFADLLSGMTELQPEILEQIREQAGEEAGSDMDAEDDQDQIMLDRQQTPVSSLISPVTARTAFSRSVTPYMQTDGAASEDSLGSVLQRKTEANGAPSVGRSGMSAHDDASSSSLASDTGSVIRHGDSPD